MVGGILTQILSFRGKKSYLDISNQMMSVRLTGTIFSTFHCFPMVDLGFACGYDYLALLIWIRSNNRHKEWKKENLSITV